jgi:leucyl/phenylalanyl-tRNA---protein transferase
VRASTTIPAEVPPSAWILPPATSAGPDGVVGTGADLAPGTLVDAYRSGIFPMPVEAGGETVLAWWSPDPRAVLPLDGLIVTRSLRRSCRRYQVRVDTAFDDVLEACADPTRPGRWITDDVAEAYAELHRLGWAHSVETWTPEGELVGGLYGVHIGGLFAGESMFHRATDASKVALVGLVEHLRTIGAALLDVQWATPHLRSLGVIELPREAYLRHLEAAVDLPVEWRRPAATRNMEAR